MNIRDIKRTLPVLLKNRIVPFLWGSQGVGKTQVVKQYAKENGLEFKALYLATQEVGDLIGLLVKDEKTNTVTHARPAWFPTEGKGIIFLDECLPGNAQILTDKGIKSMARVYNDFQDGKEIIVKSFNEKTKTFEFKKVTNAWNKGKKELIGLKMNNTKTLTCTPNHLILTENGYKEAQKLVPGEKILANVESKEKTATPALNSDQLQVVYGSILGDGHFAHRDSGSRYLMLVHCEKQKEYLEYKASIFNSKVRRIEKNGYAQKPAYVSHTRLIAEFYGVKKREIFKKAIETLDVRSLAIWYQDDGSKTTNQDSATLHTQGWNRDLIDLAVEKLNSMGYLCNIQKHKHYKVIYIKTEGFKKLSRDIAPYVHPILRYKLAEKDRNIEFVKMNSKFEEFGYFIFTKFCDVPSKNTLGTKRFVYDIEVEDNHNFIVASKESKNGIIVHNCNRAPQDVLQSLFSFILEGKLHTHVLPEGWRIVAAGNYQSDRFNVTDTSDAAWLSRFCHIDFTPTVEEWLMHVEAKGMFEVASFIREQPTMLELSSKDGGRLDTSFIKPDRRAMAEGVGMIEELDGSLPEELKYEVYSGLIGPTSAAAFISWKGKKERALSLGQILNRYKGDVRDRVLGLIKTDEKRFDLLNQPIDELVTKLDSIPHLLSKEGALDNLKQYLMDIPKELSMKAFTSLAKVKKFVGKDALLNDPEYVKMVNRT